MRRACHHPWKEANKKIQEHKKCGKRHQHQHTISFPFSVVVSSGSSFFPCEILTAFHFLIQPWTNATLQSYSWSHHRNFDSLKPQSTRYLILQCERAWKTYSKMFKLGVILSWLQYLWQAVVFFSLPLSVMHVSNSLHFTQGLTKYLVFYLGDK